jgi:hypothetical protein
MLLLKGSWYRFQNLNHISSLVEGLKKTFFQVERGLELVDKNSDKCCYLMSFITFPLFDSCERREL